MTVPQPDLALEQQINQFLAAHTMVLKAIEVHDDEIHREQCLKTATEIAERHGVRSLSVSFQRPNRDKFRQQYDLIACRPPSFHPSADSE